MEDISIRLPVTAPLLECVPNFSEGRDSRALDRLSAAVAAVPGVYLLGVEPGHGAHRTVMTFAGAPEAVTEAAFRVIETSRREIDMRRHYGAHPRMGATDVCPLVPLAGITLDQAVVHARALGERVGQELGLPVFLYEAAARHPGRRNLAQVRRGGYEGLADRLRQPGGEPDHGPRVFVPRFGAVAVGARKILVAFNVNLATTSAAAASAIAAEVRETGRLERRAAGEKPIRIPGKLKGVKGIGWYIEEYGFAQVSMNLTDLLATPVHVAYEAVRAAAADRGIEVTGSELIGLIPLAALLAAGRHFQGRARSHGEPGGAAELGDEAGLVSSAVRGLGLDQLSAFDPRRKILEYRLGALLPALG